MTFEEFIKTSNTLEPMANLPAARHIYENIICRPDVVGWMAIASELKMPALAVCAGEIEQYCDSHPGCGVDLRSDLTRKSIGRMVRAALEPVGYLPAGKKNMPKELGFRYFCGVAKRYEKQASAQFTVKVSLEPAQNQVR